MLKSSKTNILAQKLTERTLSMFEIAAKPKYKDKDGNPYKKKSKTRNYVKPVKNINKNLKSFLDISLCKMKSPLHINCKTMYTSKRYLLI